MQTETLSNSHMIGRTMGLVENSSCIPAVNSIDVGTMKDVSDMMNQFWLLLRDLSSSCRNFLGNDSYSISNLFHDIKNTSCLFSNLTD